MLTKIELIATIQNDIKTYTLYFFHKSNKMILPIILPLNEVQNLIQAKNNKQKAIPTTHDTLKRTLLCLGANLSGITIYRYEHKIFYAYLNISSAVGEQLEINAGLADAVTLALGTKSPIFIKSNLLYKQGIKISARLLKEAMEQTYTAL